MSISGNGGPQHQERGRSVSPFAVVASAHFESGPPASKIAPSEDDEIMETVQEEEWEERRKKTTTTTRNVERRVQRQVVLEDGEVIGDTGPVVTEDATEESVTKEDVSDQNLRPQGQLAIAPPEGEGWVATPGAVIVSEKTTKTTKSHDELQDEIETEEVQHCGDVTNKEAEDHIQGQSDLRELISHRQNQGWALAKPKKRVVHEATRRRGHIDTEDIRETSRIKDGHVVTETERTVREEKYENDSAPDSGSSLSDGSVHEATKETSHNLVHTKDEDLLEYYAVPKGGTLAQGVKLGEGMHVVSEDVHEDRRGNEEQDAAAVERLKRVSRRPGRRDAITKRPLNYDQEEETRKEETSKWLEHHFGSESGRSEDSLNDPEEESPGPVHSSGGNRITITMSPHPAVSEDVPDAVSPPRRWPRDPPGATPMTSTPKAPPPPPPKPERLWSTSAEPPRSPALRTTSSSRHDIHDSELAAARLRLRSTGMRLLEEDKENSAPAAAADPALRNVRSSNRFQMADPTRPSRSPPSSTPSIKEDAIFNSRFRAGKPKGHAPSAPPPPPSITNVGRSQSFHVQTLPWSPSSSFRRDLSPSNPTTSPLKDYRSEERLDEIDSRRSFHQHLNRESYGVRMSSAAPPEPSLERPSRHTRSTWSPPREATPPPPPRQGRTTSPTRRNYSTLGNPSSSSSSFGREAGTQTGPSPVPPPRTKRKKRPKSSYFFGQDNGDAYATVSKSAPNRHSSHEMFLADPPLSFSSSSRARSSPKGERRYKTTKTITPLLVVPFPQGRLPKDASTPKASWTNTVDPRRRPRIQREEDRSTTLPRKLSSSHHNSTSHTAHHNTSHHNNTSHTAHHNTSHHNNTHNASSHNTSHHNNSHNNNTYNTTHHNNTPSSYGTYNTYNPKRTFIFGEADTNGKHLPDRDTNSHRGSLHNLSITRTESQNHHHNNHNNRFTTLNNRYNNSNNSKAVGRSQSFNIHSSHPSGGRHLSELSDQRSSTAYGSTPYVNNLRSPNLIATIARTSSTRRTDDGNDSAPPPRDTNNEEAVEEKRQRFLKGLHDTAPELYDFFQGNNNGNDNEAPTTHTTSASTSTHHQQQQQQQQQHELRRTSSPPTRPLVQVSPYNAGPSAKSPTYSARVFTFGKGDNNTLTRTSSREDNTNTRNHNNNTSEHHHRTYHSNHTSSNHTSSNHNTSNHHNNTSTVENNRRNSSVSSQQPRKSTFNLKTSGGSLLYSPSFRKEQQQQQQQEEEDSRRLTHSSPRKGGRREGEVSSGKEARRRSGGDFATAGGRNSPVLIQVRDWNMR